MTALDYAVEHNHADITKSLLDRGAVSYKFPLIEAARQGNTQIVEYLMEKTIDINALENDRCGALHYAIRNGHIQTALSLIDHKANINYLDPLGCSPLYYACHGEYKNTSKIVSHLIARGAIYISGNILTWPVSRSPHASLLKLFDTIKTCKDDPKNRIGDLYDKITEQLITRTNIWKLLSRRLSKQSHGHIHGNDLMTTLLTKVNGTILKYISSFIDISKFIEDTHRQASQIIVNYIEQCTPSNQLSNQSLPLIDNIKIQFCSSSENSQCQVSILTQK